MHVASGVYGGNSFTHKIKILAGSVSLPSPPPAPPLASYTQVTERKEMMGMQCVLHYLWYTMQVMQLMLQLKLDVSMSRGVLSRMT